MTTASPDLQSGLFFTGTDCKSAPALARSQLWAGGQNDALTILAILSERPRV
jgi:hypothetical protein